MLRAGLKFQKLSEMNEDVKGWITIDNINGKNDTKIDYVVVQSDASDPEFYLHRSWMTKRIPKGRKFVFRLYIISRK